MSVTISHPYVGQLIPDFRLATADGREFRMSMFRGHRNLVLIFAAGTVPQLIADLASKFGELEEENVRVFVIANQASKRLADNAGAIPVLIDPDLAVSRRFAADHEPAVYITDQYGEIYAVHVGEQLTSADEVLACLRHINAACPE